MGSGRPFAGSALHVDRGLDYSPLAVRWTRLDKLELSDAVVPQGATVKGCSREAGYTFSRQFDRWL